MDEQSWLASTDPGAMLAWLCANPTGLDLGARRLCMPSDRKLRLWACALCRAAWPLLTDERSRRAVEVVERYVDGGATEAEVASAGMANVGVWSDQDRVGRRSPEYARATAVAWCVGGHSEPLPVRVGEVCRWLTPDVPPALQAALLRDVCGNPRRPARWSGGRCLNGSRFAPNHLWEEGRCLACGFPGQAALGIAARAYDLRDWGALPVLRDALMDAGCEDEQVLAHLAEPLHVLGCWCVDLILGKE